MNVKIGALMSAGNCAAESAFDYHLPIEAFNAIEYINKSSLVTPEVLWEQMDILAGSEDYKSFSLQILPPLPAGEYGGMLKQILCIYLFNIILVAFFEMSKDGYQIYQKSTEPDMAVEWMKQLLEGNPDFSGWESMETKAFDLFSGVQNDLMVIWRTNNTGEGNTRFLAKEGTVMQVKGPVNHYMKTKETEPWESLISSKRKRK